MKKILSLAVVLLVAAFAVDASAQSPSLVGKWNADIPSEINQTGMLSSDNVKFTFEFEGDGDCEVDILIGMTQPLDSTISLIYSMEMEFDYRWTMSGDELSLDFVEADFDVKEFRLDPSSPDMEAMLPMLKQHFETGASQSLSAMTDAMVATNMTVTFVDDNTVVLTPLDDATLIAYTLRRVM